MTIYVERAAPSGFPVKATFWIADGTTIEMESVGEQSEREIRALARAAGRPPVVIHAGRDEVSIPGGQLTRVQLHDGKYAVLDRRF